MLDEKWKNNFHIWALFINQFAPNIHKMTILKINHPLFPDLKKKKKIQKTTVKKVDILISMKHLLSRLCGFYPYLSKYCVLNLKLPLRAPKFYKIYERRSENTVQV